MSADDHTIRKPLIEDAQSIQRSLMYKEIAKYFEACAKDERADFPSASAQLLLPNIYAISPNLNYRGIQDIMRELQHIEAQVRNSWMRNAAERLLKM